MAAARSARWRRGTPFGFEVVPGRAVAQSVVQLIGGDTPVHGRYDDPGKLAGPMQRRILPPVLHCRDECIALPQADLAKPVHQCADPAIPVGMSDCLVPFGDGHRVGVAFHGREKAGSEVKHRLVLP